LNVFDLPPVFKGLGRQLPVKIVYRESQPDLDGLDAAFEAK
jgi:hypothetical protein